MAHQFAASSPDNVAPAASLERESAAGLLSRLLGDFTALVRNEVALAKAELSEAANSAKAGLAALAIAAALLLAGSLTLIAAIVLALAEVMEPWLAALIVGGVLALVGFVLLQGAKKKLQPSNLDMGRTRSAVRNDAEVLARRT
jgi:hypothetical protein